LSNLGPELKKKEQFEKMLRKIKKVGKYGLTIGGLAYASTYVMPKQMQYDIYGNFYAFSNFSRAAKTFGLISYNYINGLKGLESNSEEYLRVQSEIHTKSAERILALSRQNLGIYLKLGQYVGNLERMLPK
jgi:aarF domain-containing kinase